MFELSGSNFLLLFRCVCVEGIVSNAVREVSIFSRYNILSSLG